MADGFEFGKVSFSAATRGGALYIRVSRLTRLRRFPFVYGYELMNEPDQSIVLIYPLFHKIYTLVESILDGALRLKFHYQSNWYTQSFNPNKSFSKNPYTRKKS